MKACARQKGSLKANTDEALKACPAVHTVLVVKHTGGTIDWHAPRDCWYHELSAQASTDCPVEPMDAEDPLLSCIPPALPATKGVLHTTGGYLLFTAITHKYIFDYHDGDIYWCTAMSGGDRTFLHCLRSARQRRDHVGVRRHTHVSERVALLGGDRQASGEYLLHRADGDTRVDARGRCTGQAHVATESEVARHRR